MGKKRAMADGENRGETRFFVGGFFYRSGGNLPILGESCCRERESPLPSEGLLEGTVFISYGCSGNRPPRLSEGLLHAVSKLIREILDSFRLFSSRLPFL